MGRSIPWDEAIDLLAGLGEDPSTRFCASMQGWDHPFSREAMLLADLYDLTNLIATDAKKRNQVKPHPSRPWKDERYEHFGDTGGRSRDEVMAILTAAARGEVLTPNETGDPWPDYEPPTQAVPEPRLATNPHD